MIGGTRAGSFIILAIALTISPAIAAETAKGAAAHRGAVLDLVPLPSGSGVLSVGEDGYLGEWDSKNHAAASRYQLTPFTARSIALSPDGDRIAIVETDGLGLYRVSGWTLNPRRKTFSLRFRDRISYLSYSAGGSFILACREGREGISIIDATNGASRNGPADLTGPIAFAATGKSERTMITYSSVGALSYWDLLSGREIKRIDVPPALASPLLFGNNRYFAGMDDHRVSILHAVTGALISAIPIKNVAFALSPSDSSSTLLIVSSDGEAVTSQEYAVSDNGALPRSAKSWTLPFPSRISAAKATPSTVYVGEGGGTVSALDATSGSASRFSSKRVIRVSDASSSGTELLAVTERGYIVIPSDFHDLYDRESFSFTPGRGEDRVLYCAESDPKPAGGLDSRFVLWRADGSLDPVLYGPDSAFRYLSIPTGVPFRSVAYSDDRALFLDAAGAMNVVSLMSGAIEFSFTSIGIHDAALSGRRIFAGKSRGIAPNVPLLTIDTDTGETAPIEMRGTAIVSIIRGSNADAYAVVADADRDGPKTTIERLDIPVAGTPIATTIAEYRAEDVRSTIVEMASSIATTLGGDGATIVKPSAVIPFERTEALPIRLTNGGAYIVAVDTDGGIGWYDPDTGSALAVLRFYEDGWELVRNGERVGGPLR